MTGNLLRPGDEIDAVVTMAKPFGLLVEADGRLTGLVRDANATVGATVRLRVVEYDAARSRFSATTIG